MSFQHVLTFWEPPSLWQHGKALNLSMRLVPKFRMRQLQQDAVVSDTTNWLIFNSELLSVGYCHSLSVSYIIFVCQQSFTCIVTQTQFFEPSWILNDGFIYITAPRCEFWYNQAKKTVITRLSIGKQTIKGIQHSPFPCNKWSIKPFPQRDTSHNHQIMNSARSKTKLIWFCKKEELPCSNKYTHL